MRKIAKYFIKYLINTIFAIFLLLINVVMIFIIILEIYLSQFGEYYPFLKVDLCEENNCSKIRSADRDILFDSIFQSCKNNNILIDFKSRSVRFERGIRLLGTVDLLKFNHRIIIYDSNMKKFYTDSEIVRYEKSDVDKDSSFFKRTNYIKLSCEEIYDILKNDLIVKIILYDENNIEYKTITKRHQFIRDIDFEFEPDH